MDKYQLASEINLAVSYTNDTGVISSAGHKLYSYLADNIDEITGNQRNAYHIGSAMYFYRNYIVDKEDNIEHKLTTLIAYVNLFESFLFQDVQSIVGVYRLHILLVEEKAFFHSRILSLLRLSLNELFNMDPDEVVKKTEKLLYAAQYSLFRYCRDSECSHAFGALNDSEKVKFEQIYSQFRKQYGISVFNNDKVSELGLKVIEQLYRNLCDNDLQQYNYLGVMA